MHSYNTFTFKVKYRVESYVRTCFTIKIIYYLLGISTETSNL